jgi:hypothetical protein
MQWGVFANRPFERGEIVDVAGLTLPMSPHRPAVERSVLGDYVYGYWRVADDEVVMQLYSILLGPDMMYNHHPTDPNVEFQTFGREPNAGLETAMNPQGFVARRDIQRGEELFSTYKHGNQLDGGVGWFQAREIVMEEPHMTLLDEDALPTLASLYCSKIVAGVHLEAWRERVMPLWPPGRTMSRMKDVGWLPPLQGGSDVGWGNARAKVPVKTGERLEMGTALVMSMSKHVQGTALRPMVYAWDDLHRRHQDVLRNMQQSSPKSFMVQYQGPETGWKAMDIFDDDSLHDLALFPASGNIGMVVRSSFLQGADATTVRESNCRLVIREHMPTWNGGDDSNKSNTTKPTVGVTIELVATSDLVVGELLVLDLPANDNPTSEISYNEFGLLYQELHLTGQLYNKDIFKVVMAKRRRRKRHEKGQTLSTSDEL